MTAGRWRRSLAVSALCLLPTCSFLEGKTLVLVAASGEPGLPEISTVTITVAGTSQTQRGDLPETNRGAVRLGFYLPRGTGGTVTVTAVAEDHENCRVAEVTQSRVPLNRGDSTFVSLTLKRSNQACAAPPDAALPPPVKDAAAKDAPVPDAGVPDASAPDVALDVLPDAPADGPLLGPACRAFATAICRRQAECAPLGIKALYGSDEACVQTSSDECVVGLVVYGGSGLTPAVVQACAEAVGRPSFTCEQMQGGRFPVECSYKGDRRDGQACNYPDQCASGLCRSQPTGCGACAQPQPLGGTCEFDEDCVQPPDWYVGCWNGKCQRLGTAGDDCDVNVMLGQPARLCDRLHYCAGGICLRLAVQDGNCSGPGQCDLYKGFHCQGAPNGQCKPIKLLAPGQPCTQGNVSEYCAPGGFCSSQKRCVAPAPVGQRCDPEFKVGPLCASPFECSPAGVCEKPRLPEECKL